MIRSLVLAALTVLAIVRPGPAHADPFEFEFSELTRGVWAGIHTGTHSIPVMGNTLFVIGKKSVVVFDGGGAPLMSERIIAKIRSLTARPVSHVVISHWHGDHNFGISRFVDAYPDVQIVAHEFTRKAMQGATMDYANRLPGRVEALNPLFEEWIETGTYPEGDTLNAGDRQWLQAWLDHSDLIDHEFKRTQVTVPTLTFRTSMTLHLGNRTLELLHLGRGNTAGDVLLWLPEERILATGDQVVGPTPFGGRSYPREWSGILRRLLELDAGTVVPGHGPLLTETGYIELLIETLESVATQMQSFVDAGMSREEAEEALDLSAVEERFTGGDPFLAGRFEDWFRDPVAVTAYKEVVGEPTEILERAEEDDD